MSTGVTSATGAVSYSTSGSVVESTVVWSGKVVGSTVMTSGTVISTIVTFGSVGSKAGM